MMREVSWPVPVPTTCTVYTELIVCPPNLPVPRHDL
jgi:hypothetical protein